MEKSYSLSEIENSGTVWGKLAKKGLQATMLLSRYRPLLTLGFNFLFLVLVSNFPALAQGDPFGGSGSSKLANAGSNVLVYLTWASFFIGIVALVSIAICVYFEMNYKKNIAVAVIGLGGFAIMGSIAYDIVNLSSVSISDPTLGR